MKGAKARVAKLVRQIEKADGLHSMPSSVRATAALLTDSEEDFYLRALARGNLNVMRHGWPDFLLVDRETGAAYCVEVKLGPGDRMRPNQLAMAKVLERLGIKVYVWTPKHRDRLTPWRTFATRRGPAKSKAVNASSSLRGSRGTA